MSIRTKFFLIIALFLVVTLPFVWMSILLIRDVPKSLARLDQDLSKFLSLARFESELSDIILDFHRGDKTPTALSADFLKLWRENANTSLGRSLGEVFPDAQNSIVRCFKEINELVAQNPRNPSRAEIEKRLHNDLRPPLESIVREQKLRVDEGLINLIELNGRLYLLTPRQFKVSLRNLQRWHGELTLGMTTLHNITWNSDSNETLLDIQYWRKSLPGPPDNASSLERLDQLLASPFAPTAVTEATKRDVLGLVQNRIDNVRRDIARSMDALQTISRRTTAVMILILCGTIILGAVLPLLHYRWIVAPILRLRDAAERLSGGALIESPIEITSKDEIGSLQRAFRDMCHNITSNLRHQEQIVQNDKLASIGELAGGVAHDLNNILAVIMGCNEAAMDYCQNAAQRTELEEVHRAAERASNLTKQLLAFSRRQILVPQILDLNAIVNEMRKMFDRLIGEHITCDVHLAHELPKVKVDLGQMQQVLLNLAVNARDAMPQGGRFILETGLIDHAESHAAWFRPGEYVLLAVRDTGVGMPPDVKSRIFEPFFTTKPKNKGTGLGLSTVYGIIKQSGGHIEVESAPGQGTTFRIYLPVATEAAAPAVESASVVAPGQSRGTILLAEDEDALRRIIENQLGKDGFTILSAKNGRQALELGENTETPIKLLLTDIVMPEMGGLDLIERLLPQRPSLRVLCMTGHTDLTFLKNGSERLKWPIIQKPFRPTELLTRIYETLSPPPTH